MAGLQNFVEGAYEGAKHGQWGQVLAEWAEMPLIARRCSRYQRASSGWTFLHQAAYLGHERACRELIRLGTHVSAPSSDGRTAEDVAQGQGHAVLAQMLRRAALKPGPMWIPAADPDLLPSSNLWHEAVQRKASEAIYVGYAGAAVVIARERSYFVDSFDRILVGWHGTFDPPRGMDGESAVK